MFNFSVKREDWAELKPKLEERGIESKVELAFVSNGDMYYDIAVSGEYNRKIVQEVEKIVENSHHVL